VPLPPSNLNQALRWPQVLPIATNHAVGPLLRNQGDPNGRRCIRRTQVRTECQYRRKLILKLENLATMAMVIQLAS